MGCEVSSNEWGRIVHHPHMGALELQWRNVTMTDEAFMATLRHCSSRTPACG